MKLRLLIQHNSRATSLRKRSRTLGMRMKRVGRRTELWYKEQIVGLTKRVRKQVEAIVVPMLQLHAPEYVKDGHQSSFEDNFDALSDSFGWVRSQAKSMSELAARRSAGEVDSALKQSMKESVGVDITGALSQQPIAKAMEKAMTANVELIKSIPTEYLKQVKAVVYKAVSEGTRWESIVELVMERGDVAESRAKLIARDQVSKMNGAFNEARQTDLGIESYVWQTSGDERVRDSHADLDGETFRWDSPPTETGHPGQDVNCRCVALPVFELDKKEDQTSKE